MSKPAYIWDGTSWISVAGPQGPGVSPGGSTGQVLAKNSNDHYDTEWVDASDPFEEVGVNGVTWVESGEPVSTITVVGTQNANFGSSTSGSITLPSGMQQGDMCFVLVGSDTGSIATSSTGWTEIESTTQNGLFYKVMGASPDTTFTATSLGTASVAVAITVRGQNSDAPTLATTSTGISGMPNPPAISATAGDLVIAFGSLDDDNITPTAPTGYSNLAFQAASTTGHTVMLATKSITTTGTENPDAFGGSGTDDWVGNTVRLSPTPATYEYTANYDAESSQVKLNTSNSPTLGPSTLNFRWNSTTSLNTQMSTGQSLSCAYIATEGSTAPSIPTITIDGNAQTVLWAGGSAPVPTANTKTSYVFSIIKTASATFTVIGSGVTYA